VQVLVYQRNGKQINKNILTEQLTTKQTELALKVEFHLLLFLFLQRQNKTSV
jgi:hypothetical protein